MKEIESYKLELPRMEEYIQELTHNLEELKEEVDALRDIEDSAKEDNRRLKEEYDLQKKKKLKT